MRYANRKNVIGMSELILILPSINSEEFPSDFETAERTYGSLLDRDFSRITLIDNNSGFSTGDPPNGISELLRERGKEDLVSDMEVIGIANMDPLRKDWGRLICSYFQPLLKGVSEDSEASFLIGPGTAFLTGVMVGLASSNGSKMVVNSPLDEEGSRTCLDIDFAKRGQDAYHDLVGGAMIGATPNKTSSIQRNILVRLLEERAFNRTYSNPGGRWMSARDLATGEGMPESAQGVGNSVEKLVKSGLVIQAGGETSRGRTAMKYALTPQGIVAALETAVHHESAFDGRYDPIDRKKGDTREARASTKKKARGVIAGFRVREEDEKVSEEDSEEQANRVLNNFEYMCPVVCHVGPSSQTRFSPVNPKDYQKTIYKTVVEQRKKGLSPDIFYSICGPDWNPGLHFSSVVDALMGLPPNVDWSVDLTRMSSWDQVVFSIASNLMQIPLIYTARDRGKGERGSSAKAPEGAVISQDFLHTVLPSSQTWRLVRDLHDEPSIPERMRKLPAVLRSITKPSTDSVISREDFNRIASTNDKQNTRVRDKLDVPRTFENDVLDLGGKIKIVWRLTESGVVASEFLRAKGALD